MEQIQLTDYQEQNYDSLFGGQQDVNELLKAIQAGNITGRDTANQSLTQEPLKVESLETTLKILEFRMKDVKLWNAIPKDVAYNTVEEYVQLESYGNDVGGFYGEGQLADVQDSKYRRKAELVKYIQVTGNVTLQAQMVKSFIPAMAKEVENKTMWIIRRASNALTKANADISAVEFNGLYRQHALVGSGASDLYADLDAYQDSTAVIDLRGDSLEQEDIDRAGVNINDNFGDIDSLWAPPSVLSGLFSDYFERQRIITGGEAAKGIIGVVPKGIDTQFGTVSLSQDKFMKQSAPRILSDAATAPKAPAAPAVTLQALTGADAKSRFAAGELYSGALGAVFYGVSAVNQYGESAITPFSNTVKITLTAGQSVGLTFTAGVGGSFGSDGFIIYRSFVTASSNATADKIKYYPMFKVSAAQLAAGYDGGAAGIVWDRNRFLPGTEQAFVTEMVEEVLNVKQLAPISKLDLAVTGPSNQFLTFLWMTPNVFTPKKMVRYINVGPWLEP